MPSSTVTFGITELLEMILENATPHDLLLWQRVNKTWQAAIQRSPRIQEKLFFNIRPCKDEHEEESAVLNPFTELFFKFNELGDKFIAEDAFDGRASYPTASWKQMSLTSPAITEIYVWVHKNEHVMCDQTIACESGVTLGQLGNTQEEGNILRADFENGEYLCLCIRGINYSL